MATLWQLVSLGQEFSEKENTSRLIRSRPELFAPVAMVSSFLDGFEKVEQAIWSEVDRGKNPHNPWLKILNV